MTPREKELFALLEQGVRHMKDSLGEIRGLHARVLGYMKENDALETKLHRAQDDAVELAIALADCLAFIRTAEKVLGPEHMKAIRVDPYGTIKDAEKALANHVKLGRSRDS